MKNPSSTKLLVFDYDGVIAHSHDQLLEAIEFACKKMKLPNPTLAELQNQGFREIFKKMRIGTWGGLRFVYACKNFLAKKELPPIEVGMLEFLTQARALGYEMGIVSSNRADRIEAFLKNHKIDSYFSFVKGEVSLGAKAKILWSVSKQKKPSKMFYVGDEERDILAGQSAGVKTIAVGWGVKSAEFLKSYGPDYFVESPLILTNLLVAIG